VVGVVVSIFGRENEVWREEWYEKCPSERSNDAKGKGERVGGNKCLYTHLEDWAGQ